MNPRISDVASDITTEYEEHAQFVKLLLPEGEIDFVVSSNLTNPGYDLWTLLDRPVKVETAAEIVAKKMWHRGDRATARDLLDLCLVIERDPAALLAASEFLIRHRDTFLEQLAARDVFIRQGFSDIQTLDYAPTFDHAVTLATEFLREIPGGELLPKPRLRRP